MTLGLGYIKSVCVYIALSAPLGHLLNLPDGTIPPSQMFLHLSDSCNTGQVQMWIWKPTRLNPLHKGQGFPNIRQNVIKSRFLFVLPFYNRIIEKNINLSSWQYVASPQTTHTHKCQEKTWSGRAKTDVSIITVVLVMLHVISIKEGQWKYI